MGIDGTGIGLFMFLFLVFFNVRFFVSVVCCLFSAVFVFVCVCLCLFVFVLGGGPDPRPVDPHLKIPELRIWLQHSAGPACFLPRPCLPLLTAPRPHQRGLAPMGPLGELAAEACRHPLISTLAREK